MSDDPKNAEDALRKRIFGGSRLSLSSLSEKELEALQSLLLSNEAEIINEACKPHVIRKLPRYRVTY